MAYRGDSGPLLVELMKTVPKSFLLGERLRPPKQSAMNSWLPKRMVLLREKSPHIKHSLLVETMNANE
jgi:hypothetical protein